VSLIITKEYVKCTNISRNSVKITKTIKIKMKVKLVKKYYFSGTNKISKYS